MRLPDCLCFTLSVHFEFACSIHACIFFRHVNNRTCPSELRHIIAGGRPIAFPHLSWDLLLLWGGSTSALPPHFPSQRNRACFTRLGILQSSNTPSPLWMEPGPEFWQAYALHTMLWWFLIIHQQQCWFTVYRLKLGYLFLHVYWK